MRKKIRTIKLLLLIIVIIGSGFGYYYSRYIAPDSYSIKKTTITNNSLPDEFKNFEIGFISDINLQKSSDVTRLKKIVTSLNKENVDMVIFGGDLYDGAIVESKDVSAALKSIECKYGKFAILGEKDNSSSLEVTQILNDGGFEVLENTARTIHYKEASFLLLACHQDTDISSLKGDTKTIKIGITHQPDSFQNHKGKLDLQLSGHSYLIMVLYLLLIMPKYIIMEFMKNQIQFYLSLMVSMDLHHFHISFLQEMKLILLL